MVVAVAFVVLIVVVGLGAGPLMGARATAALACRLGVNQSALTVHISDPVPAVDLVTGTITNATVGLVRKGTTSTLNLHGIDLHTKTVSTVTATTTAPWVTVEKKLTALPAGVSLTAADGEVQVSMASRPGIKILLKLTHTATTVTVTADSMVLGGFTTPIPDNMGTSSSALGAITEAHTITPDLPQGSEITGATATATGLQINTRLKPSSLSGLGRSTATTPKCA